MNLPSENTLFKIAAIGFGLISGVAVIAFMQQVNVYLNPVPKLSGSAYNSFEGFYTNDQIFLLGTLISNAAGSFIAGAIPVLFRKDIRPSETVYLALILMLLAFFNLFSNDYPVWFWFTNLAVYIPFTWLGTYLNQKINNHS